MEQMKLDFVNSSEKTLEEVQPTCGIFSVDVVDDAVSEKLGSVGGIASFLVELGELALALIELLVVSLP